MGDGGTDSGFYVRGQIPAGYHDCQLLRIILVSPAVSVIAVITNFYDIFCNNPYVIRMMNGVRSAVIPVIIGAAWKLKKNALTDRATYLIGIAVTVICVVSDLNKLAIVVLCGLIGIAMYVKERTGRGRDLS